MESRTHKCVLLEDLFPQRSQFNREHGNLPPVVAPPYRSAQRAAQDLMPETYTDEAHAGLSENLFCKLDKFQDPRVVVEGVVFCSSQRPVHSDKIIRV